MSIVGIEMDGERKRSKKLKYPNVLNLSIYKGLSRFIWTNQTMIIMKHRSIANQFKYACKQQKNFGISRRAQKKQGVDTQAHIYSYQTMKKCRSLADSFGSFIREHYSHVVYLYQITPEMVKEFFLNKNDLSLKSKTEYLSRLIKLEKIAQAAFPASDISFMEGLNKKDLFNSNKTKSPVRNISMTYSDYKVLEEKCLSPQTRSDCRWIPLVTFRIGCRIEEAVNIRPQDIDLNRNVVRLINCKGGREREVPIRPEDQDFFFQLKTIAIEKGWNSICGGKSKDTASKFLSRTLNGLYEQQKISIDYSRTYKTTNHAIRKLFARQTLADKLGVKENELSMIGKKELLNAFREVQILLGHGPVAREQLFRVYIGDFL